MEDILGKMNEGFLVDNINFKGICYLIKTKILKILHFLNQINELLYRLSESHVMSLLNFFNFFLIQMRVLVLGI